MPSGWIQGGGFLVAIENMNIWEVKEFNMVGVNIRTVRNRVEEVQTSFMVHPSRRQRSPHWDQPCSPHLLQILIHVGFLTEESGDVFSPKVLKGGPLGEMVQWADILTALHVLGHNLKISMSVKELQG